jgi:hypothetical protein
LALACSERSRASSVESETRSHFLELVEHLQMLADALGDALYVARDIAALHRQRAAITRDGADRIFRDFLDALHGHAEPTPETEFRMEIR